MTGMIHIKPAPGLRAEFARWAVAQTPKIRTVSTTSFAVPARLFAAAPENILIGSTVDGHRYISPDEDTALSRPAPGELTGVATGEGLAAVVEERTASPGEQLPEVPAAAYPPDSVPLAEPDSEPPTSELPDVPPSDRSDLSADTPGGLFPCGGDGCDREFTTARGRDTHRRQAHPGGGE